jgi:methylenetetrahydrofolate dehydrogenase (NADP+)/methenyltetrahydrofolate cyclohydrolase
MVGDNPASEIYVKNKMNSCELVGIKVRFFHLSETISEKELIKQIEEQNEDREVCAILVQLPLPAHMNEKEILNKIDPDKDVDGLSLWNQGKLFYGEKALRPATPLAVITLLHEYGLEIEGQRVVIIGRSNLVGKPLAMMFLEQNATVTIAHSRTKKLKEICKEADILVSAIGKPRFISSEYVKKDAIVIDVGINRVDWKVVGDVDFSDVAPICSYITPVPKGIGPMTIACLMQNIYEAYLRAKGK